MRICPSCGAEAPDKDLFCRVCGKELAGVPKTRRIQRALARRRAPKRTCPSCGRENRFDAKFCSGCGLQLGGNV